MFHGILNTIEFVRHLHALSQTYTEGVPQPLVDNNTRMKQILVKLIDDGVVTSDSNDGQTLLFLTPKAKWLLETLKEPSTDYEATCNTCQGPLDSIFCPNPNCENWKTD